MSTQQNRTPLIIGVVVVVVLAGALAFAMGSGDDYDGMLRVGSARSGEDGLGEIQASDAIPFGEVTVTGAPLPGSQGGPDPAVGTVIPEVTGQDFARREMAIGPDGRAKVIVFLAHWCPHCQREVPALTEHLDEAGMPEDVDLYAVATATDPSRPNFPPALWLSKEGWPIDTMVDDATGSAATAFGIGGFPYFIAVDAQGRVVQRASGEISTSQFDSLVAAAGAGGLSS